jgi:geranylgeranyl diphosphate synthase type II
MTRSGGPGVVFAMREYREARRKEVDAALLRALPAPPTSPPVISDAIQYSLKVGGKRLRPILTLAAAEAAGTRSDPVLPPEDARALALPAACAVELIHTYSLVHDDLPAMDNDVLRRGQPTLHVQYGDGLAILAGDGLLTEAFGLLSREPRDPDGRLAPRKLRAIARLADAAGVSGMVGGQALDLQLTGQTGPHATAAPSRDLDILRDMHARKTGALIRAAAVLGGIMVGSDEQVTAALDAYASDLGLAFQIVDDVLDVAGETATLGKTAGKDAATGKLTYPSLVGLDESRRLAREAIARAEITLAQASIPSEHLSAIARWVVERTG